MRVAVAFCLAALVETALSGQIPSLPKGADTVLRKLPSLDSLTKGTPPLTTEFDDTVGPVAFKTDPAAVAGKLTDLPRAADGGFVLRPGLWEGTFQSYCLAPATYAPGSGDGYLYAPLKGSRAEIVDTILRGSGTHTEIPQGKIQLLLWAVISRSKVSDLPADQRQVAATLLTADQIKTLNAEGLGLIPPSERSRLLGSLPAAARKSLEQEADVRDRLQRSTSTYQDIERVAILSGAPPPITGPHVTRGQWSRAPDGNYFVRYLPDGFSRMRVEVLMPEPHHVRFDRLNRVVLIEDARGNKTETEYDDSIAPLTIPQDRTLKAYAFKRIRVTSVRASGSPEVHELKDKGWTFVRSSRRPSAAVLPAIFSGFAPPPVVRARWQEGGGRFEHLQERYEQAQEIKERYDYYSERIDRLREHPTADSVDQLGNLEHYRDGTKAAFGDLDSQLDWLREHQERENAALTYATGVINTLPGTPPPPDVNYPPQPPTPEYLPSTGAAVPAGRSRQRLGTSSRGS